MKSLCFALLLIPTSVFACIIGWVTTFSGEEEALTCGYMFDHCEVRLIFKDRANLDVSRSPSTRFTRKDETEERRIRVWQDDELEGPLAPALVEVDALLDRGAVNDAVARLATIRPARAQRAAYQALRLRAFECKGDYTSARAALDRLLRVDPACHGHAELLHGFILDAKEKLRDGRLDLARDSVLPSFGYDFQRGSDGSVDPAWRSLRRYRAKSFSMFDAILLQLHLQENFYGADRAIIADLYVQLGHLAAVNFWLERAVQYYEVALEYGSPKADRINAALAHYRQLIAARPHTKEEEHKRMLDAGASETDYFLEMMRRRQAPPAADAEPDAAETATVPSP